MNQPKVILENLRVRKVWGDNDPKYKSVLKVRNENRKLYPSCARCGKIHKGVCLWGKNVCYRCGKPGHHLRDCRVKGENLQVLGAPKGQVDPNAKERPLFPPCAKCGRSHKGECMAGKEGCYKCGDMGHEQRNCPVTIR